MSKAGGNAVVVELEDRDPNNLNQHLQILWDDVIGEPDGVRSPECAWRTSQHCYRYSKNFCYIFCSVLVGPLAACCLGVSFACLAFEHIWCIVPCMRCCKISLASIRTLMRGLASALVTPCAEACGSFWSGMKLQHHTLVDPPDRKEDVLLI